MKYFVKPTKQYKKYIKRLQKSGKNLSKLEKVINALAAGEDLDQRHKDHSLKGNLKGKRLCHIDPDWLLMYEKFDQELVLLLVSSGSHRDVLHVE